MEGDVGILQGFLNVHKQVQEPCVRVAHPYQSQPSLVTIHSNSPRGLCFKAQTEEDNQLIIQADIDKMRSALRLELSKGARDQSLIYIYPLLKLQHSAPVNQSESHHRIMKPPPCVLAANSTLHGRPTIRATSAFRPWIPGLTTPEPVIPLSPLFLT